MIGFFGFLSLKSRLAKMERRLLLLELSSATGGAAPEAIAKDKTTTKGPWEAAAAKDEVMRDGKDARPAPDSHAATPAPPPRYVLSGELFGQAMNWARCNWFYLVAAASLALAGIFLVQYGIETGLLSPAARVMASLALGAALVGVGESLRRKGGDGAEDLFAYLPSTFAAGGIVTLFAGVLSARMLYGLVGAETALIGLALVAVLALFIGWFYGPLLAGIGILGAIAAPFVVGGEAESATLLYYYFALIVLLALAVDTFKRWAWLSGFAALLGFGAGALLFVTTGGGLHLLAFSLIVTLAAATIPERALTPRQDGTMVLTVLNRLLRGQAKPVGPDVAPTSFPTRLLAGIFAASVAAAIWVQVAEVGTFALVILVLGLLFLLASVWMRNAPALADLAILPGAALPLVIWLEAVNDGQTYQVFQAAAERVAEDSAPYSVLYLMLAGAALSLVAAWRSAQDKEHGFWWAMGAASLAPLIALVLELGWLPGDVLAGSNWAFMVIAQAALMVALAFGFARLDGLDRSRVALFALAGMTLVALAMVLLLSAAALTLALVVMALVAVLLDRQFGLPPLAIFVQVGVVVTAWRMVIDPGIVWAMDVALWEFTLVYLAVILILAACRLLLAERARRATFWIVDAALWSISALFASLLVLRLIELYRGAADGHASIALFSLVWLISAANQLHRLQAPDTIRWIRITLAALYAVPGFGLLLVNASFANPLLTRSETVIGPYVFDTLLVAYGLPALLLLAVAVRLTHLPRWMRAGLGSLGVLHAGFYLAMEIRRFWRGDTLAVPGTTDPELYSYTVAMLVTSTALLFFAFSRRSSGLRKLALAGIGLTVAKVFLIDVSGLTGLTRVFSFLGLGLAVAGLAWLDRWFGSRKPPQEPSEASGRPPDMGL